LGTKFWWEKEPTKEKRKQQRKKQRKKSWQRRQQSKKLFVFCLTGFALKAFG